MALVAQQVEAPEITAAAAAVVLVPAMWQAQAAQELRRKVTAAAPGTRVPQRITGQVAAVVVGLLLAQIHPEARQAARVALA